MYESPIPVDKDKQCWKCKHCYQDHDNDICCDAGHGDGTWSVVDSAGTCENWEGYG